MKNIVIMFSLIFLSFSSHAQWLQTSGPGGGHIRALCPSGSDLFAGTSGGVFYSTDNGASWSAKGVANTKVMALAVSGSLLYAGGDGVYRSTDNGGTWNDVSSGLTNTDVRSLCISGSYVFAGTAAGVFRASTSGGSWTAVSSNALAGEMVFSLTVSGNFVVAGTWKGGIYRTKNDGSTWAKTNTGLTNLSVRALYRSSSSNHLYAGGEGGVHRSIDNGKTWTAMNSGLINDINYIPVVQGLSGTGSKVYAATFYGGVYYSSDKAVTWSTTALQEGSVLSVAVIGSDVFAGTHYNGVHHSSNKGGSWTAVNNGIIATYVTALASRGSSIFAGMTIPGTVAQSTDDGANWLSTGSAGNTIALLVHGSDLFAGTKGQGLNLSTDNGSTWARLSIASSYVRALAADNSYLYAGVDNPFGHSADGVHRSSDNGATWTQVNSGLTYKKVHALAVSGADLFAGTYDGGVFLSTDQGASWSAVNSGLTDLNVIALAVSGSNLYAATYGGGVFLSNNNGVSWSAVNTGITNMNANCFAVYGSKCFVGTEDGIFATQNNGSSWTDVSAGMVGSKSVPALEIKGTVLYAGTLGTGVWKRPLSEMITMPKTTATTPLQTPHLEQNYPNPFNPTTTIRYSVAEEAVVTIRVFDALGRMVAELENGMKSTGSYSAVFDAGNLPSGTYIYRLEANGQAFTGKMNLMK